MEKTKTRALACECTEEQDKNLDTHMVSCRELERERVSLHTSLIINYGDKVFIINYVDSFYRYRILSLFRHERLLCPFCPQIPHSRFHFGGGGGGSSKSSAGSGRAGVPGTLPGFGTLHG